jgi:hypothetical protein
VTLLAKACLVRRKPQGLLGGKMEAAATGCLGALRSSGKVFTGQACEGI